MAPSEAEMIRRSMLAISIVVAFMSGAAADDVPTLGPATVTEPPDVLAMLEVFRKFDDTYAGRQREVSVPAHEWVSIANELKRYTETRVEFDRKGGGEFHARAFLIKGECHLLASIEFFNSGDSRFLEQYELGIRDLAWIIRATEKIHLVDEELGFLPDYSFRDYPEFDYSAGYESIGTGFEGTMREVLVGSGSHSVSALLNRRFTFLVQPYRSLSDYQKILRVRYTGMPRQISTHQTARDLLSAFCPWGAEVFLELKRLNLVDGLDFRILAPYWGREPSTAEQLAEMVSTAGAELLYGIRSFLWTDEPPPQYDVLSPVANIALDETLVPNRISRAMWRIVGSTPETGDRSFKDISGDLGGLSSRPVRWHWVGAPTFEAWYTSPTIFSWQATDYLWLSFTVVKVLFGGPGGVIADELLGKYASYITESYGEGPVNLPVVTTIIMENYDKGLFMPSLLENGEWLSTAAMARKAAGAIFAEAEKQMTKDLYQGIDMARQSLGISYDGSDIPPILIRGNVLGFPDVPDEYPHTLEAVRFFLVYPQSGGNQEPFQKYDLSAKGARMEMDSLGWWRVPDPFGSIDIIDSFAPREQVLVFRLAEGTRDLKWSDQVMAELWTVTPGSKQQVVSVLIHNKDPFQIIIHNANDSTAVSDYKGLGRTGIGSDAPDVRFAESSRGRHHVLFATKTQYMLKILIRGDVMAEYPVNLHRGRDGQRKITGRLHSPEDGKVVLDFEPPIEIVELEVAPPKVLIGRTGPSR